MSERQRNLLILLGLVGSVALAAWLLGDGGAPVPSGPLGRVPESATAVLVVAVPEVLASPLWDRVVEERGGDRGVARIEAICGDNPFARIERAVLFAQSDGDEALSHIGVLAWGAFEQRALSECVARVVSEEGGDIREVEIDGEPGIAGRGRSRAAFLGRNGVVGGDEAAVRGALRVARGDLGSVARDPVLASLFDRVASDAHLGLVAHVPPSWRGALRRALSRSEEDLSAVAGIRAIAAGADVSRGLSLDVALAMRDQGQAQAAREGIEAAIGAALERPVLALTPASAALRDVTLVAHGSEVRLGLRLSTDEVEDLFALADLLVAAFQRPGIAADPADAPPLPEPDAVIRAEEPDGE